MTPRTNITFWAQQTVFKALLQQEDVSIPDSQEQLKISLYAKQKIL